MSIEAIFKKDYAPKREEIVIDIDGNKLVFYAVEMSFYSRQEVVARQANGAGWIEHLVCASIKYQGGAPLAASDVGKLADEVAIKFLDAALRVNGFTGESEPEKN